MEQDEEVFEIREYIDQQGQELRSEVISLNQAMGDLQTSDFIGSLERAMQSKEQKQPAGVTAEAPRAPSGTACPSDEPNPQSAMRKLLDDHDWEGIRAQAAVIEREAEQMSRATDRERGAIQGSGWKKGFLTSKAAGVQNSSSSRSGHGGLSAPVSSKAQVLSASSSAMPCTPASTSAVSLRAVKPSLSPQGVRREEKDGSASGPCVKKRVSFQLPVDHDDDDDSHRSAASRIEAPRRVAPSAFTGSVQVHDEFDNTVMAMSQHVLHDRRLPTMPTPATAAGPSTGPISPRTMRPMSRFRARALGLLDHDDLLGGGDQDDDHVVVGVGSTPN